MTMSILQDDNTQGYVDVLLYCIVLYCIVLYCIMRPYTEGQLDRYRIGIPRENPKSALNLG